AFACFREHAAALLSGEPDLFVLETFYDVRELWQAVRAVRSLTELPIVACMAFAPDPKGQPPADAVRLLEQVASWRVDAIGVNCGGPRTLLEIVQEAAPRVACPLAAMPNAGLPQE